ncbi:hypothetical protein BCR35DRAFT_300291 [Leucosporidium creatinivorum]|uniref:F-box domain-containing protein n=1 Tax=Leucosporidium creatinivorum TaxID=106004 RepID=A0A1Y2G001_9BASI|nr:hypothetical protein BCR35DRAFT_300291 [Leucosporidium creatinivorum]
MAILIRSLFRRSNGDSHHSLSPPTEPPIDDTRITNARPEVLPYHILLDIFLYAVEKDPVQSEHGGRLSRWDSHESLNTMPLICSAWEDAATTALYRLVALLGGDKARSFLDTLHYYPEHGLKVRYLVIGVGDHREECEDDTGLAEDSLDLVRVLTLCPNLHHLQVRPLHHGARTALLAALATLNLQSLVCAPRLGISDRDWATGLYAANDLALAHPSFKSFELEFGGAGSPPAVALPPLMSPLPLFLPLVELRLHCDLSDQMLWALLSACQLLEVYDVYFEKLLPSKQTARAMRASAASIKLLRFVCNPTLEQLELFDPSTHEPIFDQLLPYQQHLQRLSISATEISTNIFRLIPPSLVNLEIQSFNHVGSFIYSQHLIDHLLDPSLDLGALESLVLYDSADAWVEENVEAMRHACEARGIRFTFLPDEEMSQ